MGAVCLVQISLHFVYFACTFVAVCSSEKSSAPESQTPDSAEEPPVQLRRKTGSRDNSVSSDRDLDNTVSSGPDSSVSQQLPHTQNKGVERLISEDTFEEDPISLPSGEWGRGVMWLVMCHAGHVSRWSCVLLVMSHAAEATCVEGVGGSGLFMV